MMNKKHIILLEFILLTCLAGLKAGPQYGNPGIRGEQVNLQSDRTLYVAGETIHFSAFIYKSEKNEANDDSKILYCEFITPGAGRINGGKFEILHQKSEGCLSIPKETVSGIYYLRAYTKFMRNLGPQSYAYILLKIINPFKSEVLLTEAEHSASLTSLPVPTPITKEVFALHCDKEVYSSREQVKLNVSGQAGSNLYQNLVLSIVPDSSLQFFKLQIPEVNLADSLHRYYPETKGISITGHVYDKRTGLASSSTRVNLSILGEKDFMAVNTDSTGGFFFQLPGMTGNKELFICTGIKPGTMPTINIDNDFCTIGIQLPAPAFILSEKEQKTALNLAENTQVTSSYMKATLPDTLPSGFQDKAFYGKPSDILVLDKYIQLPTLEEYFNELPGIVKVRKRSNRPYFQFSGGQPEMSIFDPLVLVDYVAIDDMEKVLKIPPQLLSRIELVNEPYVKGDITYGGIVNILSKKNDFAGIDLPSSGVFINFSFINTGGCETMQQEATGFPDARNTIYWNPNLRLDSRNQTDILITTPDTPGQYLVYLRGITRSGEINTWSTNFEVR